MSLGSMAGATFHGASLTQVEFNLSIASRLDMTDSTLSSVTFKADLTGSDFRGAHFTDVTFTNALLTNVQLEGVDLSTTTFVNTRECPILSANAIYVCDDQGIRLRE